MKKILLFGLIGIFSLFLMQCKNRVEKTDDYSIPKRTEITGFIHHRDRQPKTQELRLRIPHLYNINYHWGFDAHHIISAITCDGRFRFVFELAQAQNITLENYVEMLWLKPGDSLHIELDFSRPRMVQFSGDKSAVARNNDLFKFFYTTGFRGKDYRGCRIPGCPDQCTWIEVRENLSNQRDFFRERRQNFLRQNRVNKDVEFLTSAMIDLDYYATLAKHLVGRWYSDWDYCADPQALMNEMNAVARTYFRKDMLSQSHFQFIKMYQELAEFIHPLRDRDFVEWANATAGTTEIREAMLAREAGRALREKNLERFEEISAQISDRGFRNRLNFEHQEILEYLKNPEPMSAIILGATRDFGATQTTENVISRIIAPNLGNVQVILFWCERAMVIDHFYTLKQEIANDDVSFIFSPGYVSLNRQEVIRQNFRERGMNEEHIFFPTREESIFVARKFRGLANTGHGLLINREGIVVDHGSHVGHERDRQRNINLLLRQDRLIETNE